MSRRESTATLDGILRISEFAGDSRANRRWDGKTLPYIPTPADGLPPSLALHSDFARTLDPVTYQVLRWRLWNVNLEHDDTIRRVCGTPIICYSLDYNTSILTENGDPVIGGPSLQRFVAQGDLSVKYILKNRASNPGIEPGDIFLLNDPYIACSHQSDVNIAAPVFWQDRLFCWVFNSAHQMDVGGNQPGSLCYKVNDIFDEPVPWPPVKLVRRGEVQQDILDTFMRQSRMPAAVALNLRSQIAGIEAASKRMKMLLQEFGAELVKGVMRRMISDTSKAVSERLLQIPDGEWQETFYLGGTPDRQVRPLTTVLQKQGDVITFSNRGTAEQIQTGNGTYCGFRGAAISCLQTLLAWDQMYCPGGVLQHLRFDPVPGTVTIATHPAPVSAVYGVNLAIALAGQVVSKMLLCGPEKLRERAIATGGLANAGYCIGWGTDRTGASFIVSALDSVIGALGASPGHDGVDTGGAWEWPRTQSGNIEEMEAASPVIYLYRREQQDSGGPGRWRGGNGVEAAFIGHGVLELNFIAMGNDPAVNNSLGLAGGLPGHSGNWLGQADSSIRETLAKGVLPRDKQAVQAIAQNMRRLSTCAETPLKLDSSGVAIAEYCAGGGYGDPLQRDPRRVCNDVWAGSVSREAAEREYGVVLTDDDQVDAAATTQLRGRLRGLRLAAATPPTAGTQGAKIALDAVPMRAITDGLVVANHRQRLRWCCSECGTELASIDRNFREGCALLQHAPHAFDERRYPDPSQFVDAELVIRRWLCPACGQLLGSEFCRADDELTWDIKLIPESLGLS